MSQIVVGFVAGSQRTGCQPEPKRSVALLLASAFFGGVRADLFGAAQAIELGTFCGSMRSQLSAQRIASLLLPPHFTAAMRSSASPPLPAAQAPQTPALLPVRCTLIEQPSGLSAPAMHHSAPRRYRPEGDHAPVRACARRGGRRDRRFRLAPGAPWSCPACRRGRRDAAQIRPEQPPQRLQHCRLDRGAIELGPGARLAYPER